jgi:hypothetical protein
MAAARQSVHSDPRTTAERRATPTRRTALKPLSASDARNGMVSFRLVVAPSEVVFVKGIVEANDGLGVVFSDAGGELFVSSPASREKELVALLADLAAELGGETAMEPAS